MATVITRTLGPGLTVSGTINENGILIYTITLPSGKTIIVTDEELGSLVISEVGTGLWLFTVGTLAVGSSDNPEDRGAILTLDSSRDQIAAIGVELKNEQPLVPEEPGIGDGEEEEEPVENEEPEEPEPEELTGYGYTIPEEEPIEYPEPEEVGPEELTGYGYTIPEEEEGELSLTRDPEYVSDEEAAGYGDYPVGEPVLADDGTPSGFYRNPETGEIYDPNGPIENEEPGSSTEPSARGLVSGRNAARASASIQDQYRTNALGDWRVNLRLAPEADYLYMAESPGILAPLAATNGVVFPYTPSIQTTYTASYDTTMPVHSNYKIFQYTASAVDSISITCDFTAQDTFEANYLLATIHFFKSVAKMFYGQDRNPIAGTPPPLLFLTGYGEFQYNAHPLILTSFTYSLPNDVDYIRAYLTEDATAQSASGGNGRLGTTILPGGLVPKTVFGPSIAGAGASPPTYVPTRISIQLNLLPVVTRNQISNVFSLKDYSTGQLLRRGIW